jgi:hypothetical protein
MQQQASETGACGGAADMSKQVAVVMFVWQLDNMAADMRWQCHTTTAGARSCDGSVGMHACMDASRGEPVFALVESSGACTPINEKESRSVAGRRTL